MKESNNSNFDDYYSKQNIFKTEEEFLQFKTVLREELPISFRVVSRPAHCSAYLRSVINKMAENTTAIRRLNWYLGDAYSMSVSRVTLKSTPKLKSFHEFLVHESETGNVVRQEAVSMIPVLFLMSEKTTDEGRFILDMCAAPGSKTSQLLEMIDNRKDVLIANEICSKRAHMMIHRLSSIGLSNFIVTNHMAQFFPATYITSPGSTKAQLLFYDAILCDVPCSGDGTMRKSKCISEKWHPGMGIALHRLQIQILRKAIEICKVGGTVAYSTCSFNPIENEAVVGGILDMYLDSLELLDYSNKFTELISRPGLTKWRVLYKNEWYNTYDEYLMKTKNKLEKSRLVKRTMFPIESSRNQLIRCMRFYPHLQNTGGFFVAILKKVANTARVKSLAEHENQTSSTSIVETKPVKDSENAMEYKTLKSQQDFVTLSEKHDSSMSDIWEYVGKPYGFGSLQPHTDFNFLVRKSSTAERAKHIYVCTNAAAKIVHAKFRSPLKIISAGCVAFENSHKFCRYRPTRAGLECMIDILKIPFDPNPRRVVIVKNPQDLIDLLVSYENPVADESPQSSDVVQNTKFRHRIAELKDERMKRLIEGLDENAPCIFEYNIPEFLETLRIGAWRGVHTIELLLNIHNRTVLLNMLKAKLTIDFSNMKFY